MDDRLFAFALLGSFLAGCVGEDPGAGLTTPIAAGAEVVEGGPSKSRGGEAGADGEGEPVAVASPTDVHVLRDPKAAGHPAYGTNVRVEDMVVTGVKSAGATHGFFVQHRTTPSFGAVFVFVGPAVVPVTPGAVVSVSGQYKAYRSLDEIDASTGAIEQTGTTTIPAPLEVTVGEISEGGPRALELQSALLSVRTVVTTKATSGVDFIVTAAGGGGGQLVVTSYIANGADPSPFPAVLDQTFSSIRGFGFKSGPTDATAVAKLAPASAADLVSP